MNMLTRNERQGFFPARTAMDNLMDVMFGDFPGFPTRWEKWMPKSRLNVKVNEKEVTLKLPAAGCKPADFEIETAGDFVTVKVAKRQTPVCEEDEKKHFTIRERSYEEFQESVKLPVEVKGAEAKAKYVDGVLSISIPRAEIKKITSKKVQVK